MHHLHHKYMMQMMHVMHVMQPVLITSGLHAEMMQPDAKDAEKRKISIENDAKVHHEKQ